MSSWKLTATTKTDTLLITEVGSYQTKALRKMLTVIYR